MSVEVHILESSGRLPELSHKIRAVVEETVEKVETKFTLPLLDIVVADNPGQAIPETGIGGFSPTPHLVFVSINPKHPDLEEALERRLKSTVAHELHHAARSVVHPRPSTLLENFVAEGLADHFDIEINGGEIPLWSTALTQEEIHSLLEKARPLFDSRDYNFYDWFFGSEEQNIPKWTAYSIGFYLVDSHLKKTGKTASQLVTTPAIEFVD